MTITRNLIVASHHDDAEFGCGGLMAMATTDDTWRALVIASGDYPSGDRLISGKAREAESRRALDTLNCEYAKPRVYFDENGGRLWHYPTLVNVIESEIGQFHPTDLYLPWRSYNQDHAAVHDACITALRPIERRWPWLQRVWAYEYPGNGWAQTLPEWGRRYVALDDEAMGDWFMALLEHKTQRLDRPDGHVTIRGAKALAMLRGSEACTQHAQCVWLLKEWT